MTTQNITKLAVAALLGGAALLPAVAAQAQAPFPHPHNLNQRFHDQNARIRQGVASGQLTRAEARHDRYRLARARFQDTRDRNFDGGRLTPGQRQRLNGALNRNRGDIYRTRHNDQNR